MISWLDTSMIDRQKTERNSREGDIKLETSFEMEFHMDRCWDPYYI